MPFFWFECLLEPFRFVLTASHGHHYVHGELLSRLMSFFLPLSHCVLDTRSINRAGSRNFAVLLPHCGPWPRKVRQADETVITNTLPHSCGTKQLPETENSPKWHLISRFESLLEPFVGDWAASQGHDCVHGELFSWLISFSISLSHCVLVAVTS